MKLIKNWKTLILISLIVGIALLYGVLYKDASTLPSDNWSRSITLETTENIVKDQAYYQNYFDVIYSDQTFIISKIIDQTFIISSYNEHLVLLKQESYDFSTYINTPIEYTQFFERDGLYHVQYYTEHQLYQFDINSDFSMVNDPQLIDENISVLKFKDDHIVYAKDNSYFYKSDQESIFLFERDDVELYDFDTNDDQSILYIGLLTYSNGKYRANTIVYDLNDLTYESNQLGILKQPSATVPLEVDAFYNDNMFYTLFSMKNTKYGQNLNSIFLIDTKTNAITSDSFFNNYSYTPRFDFTLFNHQMVLLFNDLSFVGKTDVGSQNKTYTNVLISPNFDNTFVPLTNTQNFAANSILLSDGNHDYLFTNEVANGKNKIILNTNQPDLINQSLSFSTSDYLELLVNAFTFIPASLFALFSPFILLLFPVVIIILPIAIFKMTWAERNQLKMLYISICTYAISKLYYLINNRDLLIYNDLSSGAVPWHLSSLPLLLLINVFTGFMSYGALVLYRKKHKDSYFIIQFAFFFAMDLIQFLFYVQVYSVMFI